MPVLAVGTPLPHFDEPEPLEQADHLARLQDWGGPHLLADENRLGADELAFQAGLAIL
jgi:hypothetical protein